MSDRRGSGSIEGLAFWPAGAVTRLSGAGVSDPGQLLAMADTDDGRRSLATQTGLDPAELDALIERTRSAVGQTAGSAPIDTSDYGLGVLPPKDAPDNG